MRKRHKTPHSQAGKISLDTKKCTACWECIEICQKNVPGRINFPWHKHAKIKNIENCIGCLKCVRICTSNAIIKLS